MLKFYSKEILLRHTKTREGETKLGSVAHTIDRLEDLEQTSQKYVLLGIPEDIGVRANSGKEGTAAAWHECFSALLNIQDSELVPSENLLILGEIDCENEMKKAGVLDADATDYLEQLGALVKQLDDKVSNVIEKIVAAGKVPIVIGGGHNNSFGIIKGTSNALQKSINCINFDAHTDFRTLEHRHSGNGFSYAYHTKFLEKYFVFGLHRNYTSQSIFESIHANENVRYHLFETISVLGTTSFYKAMQDAENHCCKESFGLEIDLDAVAYMGSSAMTPSGFTLEQCRRFTTYFSGMSNCTYIHICEGAPNREVFPGQVAKALTYLISDIISK